MHIKKPFIHTNAGRPDWVKGRADCAVRACVIATGESYENVWKELNERQHSDPSFGTLNSTWRSFLEVRGWIKVLTPGLTLNKLFELPRVTCIVSVRNHVFTIKDHVVHDGWYIHERNFKLKYIMIKKEDSIQLDGFTPISFDKLPDGMKLYPICMVTLMCKSKAHWRVTGEFLDYKNITAYACDECKTKIESGTHKPAGELAKTSKRKEALMWVTKAWQQARDGQYDLDEKKLFDELEQNFPDNGAKKNLLHMKHALNCLKRGVIPK
jgi:hypothetical protein